MNTFAGRQLSLKVPEYGHYWIGILISILRLTERFRLVERPHTFSGYNLLHPLEPRRLVCWPRAPLTEIPIHAQEYLSGAILLRGHDTTIPVATGPHGSPPGNTLAVGAGTGGAISQCCSESRLPFSSIPDRTSVCTRRRPRPNLETFR